MVPLDCHEDAREIDAATLQSNAPHEQLIGLITPFSWVVYSQANALNLVDRQNRTIWFMGDAGPLAPSKTRTRHTGKRKDSPQHQEEQTELMGALPEIGLASSKPKRAKRSNKRLEQSPAKAAPSKAQRARRGMQSLGKQ